MMRVMCITHGPQFFEPSFVTQIHNMADLTVLCTPVEMGKVHKEDIILHFKE